jgi:hypothetical protein
MNYINLDLTTSEIVILQNDLVEQIKSILDKVVPEQNKSRVDKHFSLDENQKAELEKLGYFERLELYKKLVKIEKSDITLFINSED